MRYVLHFGLAKTGSTALRVSLFPAVPGVALSLRSEDGPSKLLRRVRYSGAAAAALPGAEPAYIDALAAKFKASPNDTSKDITVISDETVIGPHPDGIPALVGRIKRVCPDAKIVLVFRDPREMLKAMYRQDVENLVWQASVGTAKVADVAPLNAYLETASKRDHAGTFGYIRYNEMIAAFENAYGTANCLFLSFRQLRHEPIVFLKTLIDFMGVQDFAPTSLPQENVSANKMATLMQTAGAAGYSEWQLEQLARNYTSPVMEQSMERFVQHYVADHAFAALSRIKYYYGSL